MKIPVFVSCPTSLNPAQNASRKTLMAYLDELSLEPRALGRSDYPADCPLREVLTIALHCAGGLILGFEQFQATAGKWKRGVKPKKEGKSKKPAKDKMPVSFPTPWNNLEAGILFGLGLPILIFKEEEISGGVFDVGTTEAFVHQMPVGRLTAGERESLKEVFLKWHARVSSRYYTGVRSR